MTKLGCDCLRLGNFLRFQPLALQHVQEIGVAAEIELILAIKPDATFAKQIREHAMCDCRAYLRFHVVTDDGQPAFSEPSLPVFLRRNKHRNAIHKRTIGFENLLDVPFRCHLRTNR